MFNSNDKDQFVVGKEYYTYYMEITNRGNKLRNYTGVMKIKVISNDPTQYSPRGYTMFEIIESKKLTSSIKANAKTYMNGYGSATTNFYDDYDTCVKDHDKDILNYSKGQTTDDRDVILNKLINKQTPINKSKIEVDSIRWYKSLSGKQKQYISWLKEYYDEIH
jgi:hypothetical protein